MNSLSRCALFLGFAALASIGFAQPVPSSGEPAKERRQGAASTDKARPDRSQAEAKRLKSGQKEASDQYGNKMQQANTGLQMGVASGATQMGGTGGATKKSGKLAVTRDAVKQPVQQPLSK